MSHEEEWLELNNLYWKQHDRMTQFETLLKGYSTFAARLHTTSLSPELHHERDALQARTWEILEGKEKPGK